MLNVCNGSFSKEIQYTAADTCATLSKWLHILAIVGENKDENTTSKQLLDPENEKSLHTILDQGIKSSRFPTHQLRGYQRWSDN